MSWKDSTSMTLEEDSNENQNHLWFSEFEETSHPNYFRVFIYLAPADKA